MSKAEVKRLRTQKEALLLRVAIDVRAVIRGLVVDVYEDEATLLEAARALGYERNHLAVGMRQQGIGRRPVLGEHGGAYAGPQGRLPPFEADRAGEGGGDPLAKKVLEQTEIMRDQVARHVPADARLELEMVDEAGLAELEPLARTIDRALPAPSPGALCPFGGLWWCSDARRRIAAQTRACTILIESARS